jgi:hypothetical protein
LLVLQMLAQASLEGLLFSTGGNVLHEVLLHGKEVGSPSTAKCTAYFS